MVVAVDGEPVKSNIEMTREVAKTQPGDVIHLDVFRDGKERTVDIRSGLRPSELQLTQNGGQGPDDEQGGGSAAPAHPAAGPAVLGMQFAPLDATTRGQFNIPDTVKGGAVVASIKGTSDAADKGLQKGDVIVQAGGHQIASAGDLAAAVTEWKKAGRSSIPIAVRRGGQMLGFVPLKIDG